MVLKINQLYLLGKYNLPKSITQYMTVKPNSLHYKALNYFYRVMWNKMTFIRFNNYQYTQTNVQSLINWSKNAFIYIDNASVEAVKFFNYLGFDFKAGVSKEEYLEIIKKVYQEDVPSWPKEGSIIETENYIVVNF